MQHYITLAEKEENKNILSRFINPVDYEEVAQNYYKAAEMAQQSGKYDDAIINFEKAHKSFITANKEYLSNRLIDISLKLADISVRKDKTRNGKIQSIKYLERAIETTKQYEKFFESSKIGGYYERIATIYFELDDEEKMSSALLDACFHYESAGRFHSASKCLNSVVDRLCNNKNYSDAVSALNRQIELQTRNYNTIIVLQRDLWIDMMLCSLANSDVISTRRILAQYTKTDTNFENSIDYELVTRVCTSIEEGDIDTFADITKKYDDIKKLNPRRVNILLDIKKMINGEELC